METLKIKTGEKRIAVSVDGVNGREIVFNPNDTRFMEHLHHFYKMAMQKAKEWDTRQADIERQIAAVPTDENGIPETLEPAIGPIAEMNTFMRQQIDDLFGVGTAASIFGDAVYRNPEIYIQLVEGIAPYVEPVRAQKVQKYTRPRKATKARKPRKRATKKAK